MIQHMLLERLYRVRFDSLGLVDILCSKPKYLMAEGTAGCKSMVIMFSI